jgi:hypothetical protein
VSSSLLPCLLPPSRRLGGQAGACLPAHWFSRACLLAYRPRRYAGQIIMVGLIQFKVCGTGLNP